MEGMDETGGEGREWMKGMEWEGRNEREGMEGMDRIDTTTMK